MKNLNVSGLRLLSLLTILGLTVNAFGQSEPLWTHTVEGNINWLKLAPTGHLIVSTKESLVGVDSENGEILWTREDLKGLKERPIEFYSWLEEFIPFTPYAVVRKHSEAGKTFKHEGAPIYINVINTVTGEDIVTTEAMGLRDQYGYFLLPEIGGMLIFALDKDKKQTVIALELQTGKVIWENKESFKFDFFDPDVDTDPGSFVPRTSEEWGEMFEKAAAAKYAIPDNQPPLFDTEESMITFMTKKGIRKFSSKTGELMWETNIKAKHAPYLTYGYAAMLLNDKDKVIYAASDKTVYAVRTEDGSLLWEKAPKLKGRVSWMRLTPQGLLVRGGSKKSFIQLLDLATGQPIWEKRFTFKVKENDRGQMSLTPQGLVIKGESFINLIDLATGKPVWKKKFKKLKDDATNFVVEDDKVVVCSDKKLYAINLSDGAYTEIAKKLKFEGKETPGVLTLRDDGYFLQSSNNLMLVSFSGEKVFHTYHKAPGLSFAERMVGSIARKAVGVAAGQLGGWEVDREGAHEQLGHWAPVLYMGEEGFGRHMYEKRFKDTENRDTYTYILTKIKTKSEKGFGFVRVNKFNGKTEGHIILGTKTPVHQIDEIESWLYFKSDKQEIVCYKF